MKRGFGNCYWADEVAIGILEKILNVKMIILSSEYYKDNDLANVLENDPRLERVIQCGVALDDINIQKDTEFEAQDMKYIIVDHTGNHYKLITYKKHGAMTFKELPYGIKRLIVNRCYEGSAGPFRGIPEIEEFYEQNKTDADKSSLSEEQRVAAKDDETDETDWACQQCTLINDANNENCQLCDASKPIIGPEIDRKSVDERLDMVNKMGVEEIDRDSQLSNQNTVFQFYEKSSPKPLPGKGAGKD